MKGKLKDDLMIMLKGYIIGSSMSVPGVSGSTMAILLGIYDRLISSISRFLKDIKGNVLFLLKFCIGAGAGICTLSFLIKWLLEKFPIPVSVFFLGAVVGGIPALYKKTKESPFRFSSGLYFLLGFIIVISIGFIPAGSIDISFDSGLTHYLMLLVTGVVIALALVLPGISTSHMLLVLGMYDAMLDAITKFDVVYIGILGVATLIGVFLITKPIEWILNSFPHQTYWMIIGFVLGSTYEIFRDKIVPAIPESADVLWWIGTVVMAVAALILGFMAIKALSRFQND
ncbi:putative membrane protein [Thermoclostridium caenicola]|uniref:Putative membrane protein n=1 Tax=Thermoclostridium caenicola TaxID=659425 RepID=A0A1M6AZ10_9FIRM|nr:DUF368 domain-containing protein [Thermoclostridium caenicola]SHI41473.1 putative membrane protein [Thermoclostridium caenicola]HPO77885.1 DUF368 domain-containing protein [Thermoclostridium caenicola]